MRRLVWAILICFFCCVSQPQPLWGQVRPDLGLRTLDIKEPESDLGLIWHANVVPGEELLIVKTTYTRYGMTFYGRYRFAGIVANSMKIEKTGASQSKGDARAEEDSSFEKTFYVERAPDGSFFFVPEDLKDVGAFKIRRDDKEPSRYLVTFDRRTN